MLLFVFRSHLFLQKLLQNLQLLCFVYNNIAFVEDMLLLYPRITYPSFVLLSIVRARRGDPWNCKQEKQASELYGKVTFKHPRVSVQARSFGIRNNLNYKLVTRQKEHFNAIRIRVRFFKNQKATTFISNDVCTGCTGCCCSKDGSERF